MSKRKRKAADRVNQQTDAGVIHQRIGKFILTGGAP